MRTKGVDSVYVWTSDMDRSIAFYEEVLGLELAYRGGNDWAEFKAGSIRLALHGAGGDLPAGGTVVFEVDDLDAAKAVLADRSIDLTHEGEVEGRSRFVEFRDPDGNGLSLIEHAHGGEPE